MVNLRRWLLHSVTPKWWWQRPFPGSILSSIEWAVTESERRHRGELRFVIEGAMPGEKIWQNISAYQRAVEIFSEYRVWDTEENTGILIYLCLADREVHILADRGINRYVPPEQWESIVTAMREAFAQGRFEQGSLLGIERATDILASQFPAGENNQNELPDRPTVI